MESSSNLQSFGNKILCGGQDKDAMASSSFNDFLRQ